MAAVRNLKTNLHAAPSRTRSTARRGSVFGIFDVAPFPTAKTVRLDRRRDIVIFVDEPTGLVDPPKRSERIFRLFSPSKLVRRLTPVFPYDTYLHATRRKNGDPLRAPRYPVRTRTENKLNVNFSRRRCACLLRSIGCLLR